MTPNKDTPAFPTITWDQLETGQIVQATEYAGLTKREQIAAMAMQGICASEYPKDMPQGFADWAAEMATYCADALLFELSKPQP